MRPLAILLLAIPLCAQGRLDPDAPNCTDSKSLPKLLACRIDNCESKDGDHRDFQIREDDKGDPVTSSVDGNSRAVMYECPDETTAAEIIEKAASHLRAYGYDVPYQFADKEGRADRAQGRFVADGGSRRALQHAHRDDRDRTRLRLDNRCALHARSARKSGKAPLYGITFLPGRADIAPESVIALREIFALMQDNPEMRLRVEGHTDSTGTKAANQILSVKRAQAVVDYLVNRGLKRIRLEVAGMGDADPVADNSTEAGRTRNRRIQLVKIEPK